MDQRPVPEGVDQTGMDGVGKVSLFRYIAARIHVDTC